MSKKVGICNALMDRRYVRRWRSFLESLDFDVIVSPETNVQIKNMGLEKATAECCLPLKIFFGHCCSLKDRVDHILVPRYVRITKGTYMCPVFLGLPDMVRAILCDDSMIWEIKIDFHTAKKTDAGLRVFAEKAQKPLAEVKKAFNNSLEEIPQEATHWSPSENKDFSEGLYKRKNLRVAVIGRPYVIFDPECGGMAVKILQEEGCTVYFPNYTDEKDRERSLECLARPLFWSSAIETAGSAFHMLRDSNIDGIVHISSFACGPDSLVTALIGNRADELGGKTPFLSLIVDEHSSVEGIRTRLEAFLDILDRMPDNQTEDEKSD